MFGLDNKNTVITGGGSGIGKAVALLFAKQGAAVHVVDINKKDAQSLAAEIEAAGGRAVAHECNVSDQSQVDSVFKKIERIDTLVNCAGVSHIGRAHTTSEADMDRL